MAQELIQTDVNCPTVSFILYQFDGNQRILTRANPQTIQMLAAAMRTCMVLARVINYYLLLLLFICLMKIKTRMSSNTIMARRPQETSRLIIEATSTVVDKQNKST